MSGKLPYEKPDLKVIDLANVMDDLERGEGELYKQFNDIADRLEGLLAAAQTLEDDLQASSQRIDELRQGLNKAAMYISVAEAAIPKGDA